MAHVFLTTPEHRLMATISRELLADGVDPGHIQVFTTHPEQTPKLPVALIRYRSPGPAMWVGGLIGAVVGALIGVPLLVFGGFGIAPTVVIAVVGAVTGALLRLWFGRSLGGDLYRLDPTLRRGEAVMVMEVEKRRIGELEQKVKSRHPEVSVLGTDPEGTPPFP